jgi:hypothetical protein
MANKKRIQSFIPDEVDAREITERATREREAESVILRRAIRRGLEALRRDEEKRASRAR